MFLFNKKIKKMNDKIKEINDRLDNLSGFVEETYWANVFRDTIVQSSWLIDKTFSPGRWAASYLLLYVIYRILNEVKPSSILECGLGQSSRLSIQYAKKFNPDLVIYEDSAEWADFFAKSYPEADEYIKFMESENQEVRSGVKSLIYKDFKASLLNKKFDFVMVDAPKGSLHCSRYQLLDVAEHLKDSFVVLLDDCERFGEKETWQYFKQKLRDLKIDFVEKTYSSDKTVAMACSPDWAFLTTL